MRTLSCFREERSYENWQMSASGRIIFFPKSAWNVIPPSGEPVSQRGNGHHLMARIFLGQTGRCSLNGDPGDWILPLDFPVTAKIIGDSTDCPENFSVGGGWSWNQLHIQRTGTPADSMPYLVAQETGTSHLLHQMGKERSGEWEICMG